jgi:acyl dehydratase
MAIRIGQTATFKCSLTQKDFDRFAALSGDDNPIHVDPEFAARTRFGRTVAHGMLLYAAICRVLGTQLPGPGCRQLGQSLIFRHPTYAHTEISVHLEVVDLNVSRHLADIRTLVLLPDGKPACEGQTRVRMPGRAGEPGDRQPRIDPPKNSDARTLGRLALGQRASIRRTFTREELAEYADLTGDTNPLFHDPDYARGAGFRGCIVPGPLLSCLFSRLLGTELPGRGTNWLKQRLVYPAAVAAGSEVCAAVEIVRLRPEKYLVNLSGTCADSAGITVCRAESLVLVKDLVQAKS